MATLSPGDEVFLLEYPDAGARKTCWCDWSSNPWRDWPAQPLTVEAQTPCESDPGWGCLHLRDDRGYRFSWPVGYVRATYGYRVEWGA